MSASFISNLKYKEKSETEPNPTQPNRRTAMEEHADSCAFCGIDGGDGGVEGGRIPVMFKSSASNGARNSSASDGARKKTNHVDTDKSSEKREKSENSENRNESGGSSSSANGGTTTRVFSDGQVKELFALASASV